MSDRPAIPLCVSREILIESGHRCAVCGAGCPLEKAHIIPWHKTEQHIAKNLICLCANCHQRADHEKWGEKVLKEYKAKPWVHRRYEKIDSPPEVIARVLLTIQMEISNFDEKNQRFLQNAIAGFLEIRPSAVRISSIEEGSVKVSMELPASSAERLLDAYERNDPALAEYLFPLLMTDLQQVALGEQRTEMSTETVGTRPIASERLRKYVAELGFSEERLSQILSPETGFPEFHDAFAGALALIAELTRMIESIGETVRILSGVKGLCLSLEGAHSALTESIDNPDRGERLRYHINRTQMAVTELLEASMSFDRNYWERSDGAARLRAFLHHRRGGILAKDIDSFIDDLLCLRKTIDTSILLDDQGIESRRFLLSIKGVHNHASKIAFGLEHLLDGQIGVSRTVKRAMSRNGGLSLGALIQDTIASLPHHVGIIPDIWTDSVDLLSE